MSSNDFLEIPGYTIIKILGKGGMGVVYLAEQKALHRKVALKVTLPQLSVDDPSFAKRFVLEAKATAALDHKNIIRVYDAGVHENSSYMAMQFIPTGDLTALCKKPQTHIRICQLFIGISEGLEAAHKANFVHRDIKPDNILIDSNGVPLLTDFGIVKTLSEENTNLTLAGGAIGTPKYMSPEQIQAQPLDGRSDLYSVGVMLFNVLENELPFDDETPMAICVKHITIDPPPLSDTNSLFQPIVSKLLEKSPDDRYNNARQLILALKKLLIIIEDPNSVTPKKSNKAITGKKIPNNKIKPLKTLKIDNKAIAPSLNKYLLSSIFLAVIFGIGYFYYFYVYETNNDITIPVSKPTTEVVDNNSSNDQNDYLLATKENSLESYNKYINEHPKGQFISQAKNFIEEINNQQRKQQESNAKLVDDSNWEFAKSINSIESYNNYIQKNKDGAYLSLARINIDTLNKASKKPTVQTKKAQIIPLLSIAQSQFKNLNLLQPQGKNAYESYLKILTIEPNNIAAKKGLLEIINKYEELAKDKFNKNEKDSALEYINNAINIREYYIAQSYSKNELYGQPDSITLINLNELKQKIIELGTVKNTVVEKKYSIKEMYDMGLSAYKRQNFKNAAKWLEVPAKQNNVQAQVYLGSLYYSGNGVTQNYKTAIDWYEKAANQNNIQAQMYLGLMHEEGKVISKNYDKSLVWYEKAASQNHAPAQNSLGFFYQEGLSVKKDLKTAIEWYTKAADQDYTISQKQLGLMNLRGTGMRKSTKKAFEWYEKSAYLNDMEAQDILGTMYEMGKGVKKDNVEAVSWYKKAANQGYEPSIKKLAARGITSFD